MKTVILFISVLVLTLLLARTSRFKTAQAALSDRLQAARLSRVRLLLCSRAHIPLLALDFAALFFFPTLSLPMPAIILLSALALAAHCVAGLLSLAAYELIGKK